MPVNDITSFWQAPYAAKRTEFSATFAAMAGVVPAYNPRTIPSLFSVDFMQEYIPEYIVGNVCIFTFTVSNGCPTYTKAMPP